MLVLVGLVDAPVAALDGREGWEERVTEPETFFVVEGCLAAAVGG